MKDEIAKAVEAACKELFGVEAEVELARPDEQFGDFATNVALQLAGKIENPPAGGPRAIAEAIAENVKGRTSHIEHIDIAGPGFLNLKLTDSALFALAEVKPKREAGEVIIETNNPNPFKAMHIGHALNAIAGETLANLLEASGKKAHRVSYHGDVGAHVGKSMYSLLRYVGGNPDKLNDIPPGERNSFMSRMYAEGSKAYKEDEQAKAEIDKLAEQSFTREDPIYAKVYDICKSWSFEQIDAIVARMGNKPIERRYLESEADSLGVEIIKKHVGEIFIESDGAIVFPGSKYGSFDNVFVGSNGRGLYAARDLGLMKLKANDFPNAAKSYIVTAEEQRDYFVGVIKAAELCLPELKDMTVNIPHGTVKLTTGKMSSRSGDVLEISWLFEQIDNALKEAGGAANDEIAAGALRYEFLRSRISSDIVFDVQEAVSIKGNSGPYLQYAHARARSILKKSEIRNPQSATNLKLEADERSLLRKIGEYSEVVDKAVADLMPHHICTYLYELAQVFNRFYEHNRVIGDERQDVRLRLVADYADTLKNGLNLLGIPAPEKM